MESPRKSETAAVILRTYKVDDAVQPRITRAASRGVPSRRTSSASPSKFPLRSCIPEFVFATALPIALRNTRSLHGSPCSLIHRADIAHHEIREKVVLR